MYNKPPQKKVTKNLILISIIFFGTVASIFAQESNQCSGKSASKVNLEEKNFTELQKQARLYRNQGMQFQKIGDLEMAMSFYQKAIELDPSYTVAYNDLGIIYEAKGFIERAEESYLKSIKIDPAYLSAYSNLALLYENKRELEKAAFYWNKRVELGLSHDPWTEKARQRLGDIQLVLGEMGRESEEQKVIDFMKDISIQKSILKQDNKAFAKSLFDKAKLSYKKGDEVTAFKLALDAQQLDPSNTEIGEFIKKLQTRLLSR